MVPVSVALPGQIRSRLALIAVAYVSVCRASKRFHSRKRRVMEEETVEIVPLFFLVFLLCVRKADFRLQATHFLRLFVMTPVELSHSLFAASD